MNASRPRVSLLGAGTVGGALLDIIERLPIAVDVTKVLVRDPSKPRTAALPGGALTTDPQDALEGSDVLVELIGGTGLAGDLMLRALADGKSVVTANKAALAERWNEFLPYLAEGRVHFEAAVMAGTPVIGPLAGALRGSRPIELHAILNGTCNYILSQLEAGTEFDAALREAQRLGYAEADPGLDIDGYDAAHKLTLLARLAFDPDIRWEDVRADTRGITSLTPEIVRDAMQDGGRIRLVGSVYPHEGRWRATVRPVYLPPAHALASSASNRNGLVYCGDPLGEIFTAGAGAGAGPTASAVAADLLAAIRGGRGPTPLSRAFALPDPYDGATLGEIDG